MLGGMVLICLVGLSMLLLFPFVLLHFGLGSRSFVNETLHDFTLEAQLGAAVAAFLGLRVIWVQA